MRSRILFIHQNFPGQFRHIAPYLKGAGYDIRALGMSGNKSAEPIFRDILINYSISSPYPRVQHPLLQDFEAKVLRAEAVFKSALNLADQGYKPDLIFGHPGWGELLFLDRIWPDVPQLHYLEYYYRERGQDMNFDPEFGLQTDLSKQRFRLKNTSFYLSADTMHCGITPTHWQFSTLPSTVQERTRVIHDGIQTNIIRPESSGLAFKALASDGTSVRLKSGDHIVTFINRSLEPFRGYHSFMRSLPELFRIHPGAFVVIVGREGASYGPIPDGKSWKIRFLDEVRDKIPLNRLIYTGMLSRQQLTQTLQMSRVHVYLSYPFVLSWSLLEAMSAGVEVIASDTLPVREVIEHGKTGWLVDFFDNTGLAHLIHERLSREEGDMRVGQQARKLVIERYDLDTVCLPKQLEYIEQILNSRA